MTGDEDIAGINYYARRKLYHHVVTVCESALRRKPADPVLLFWRAFGWIMEGRSNEALRELQNLMEKRDLVLACPTAMIYAHERSKLVDHEAIEELQARLTIASSSASLSEQALVQVALFHWHTANLDSAKEWLRKTLDMYPNSFAGLTAMGWVELASGHENLGLKANTWFDRVLEKSSKDLEALMGRLTFLRKKRRQLTPALDITAQIIVYNPTFIPAYIERMYVLLEMAAWDQVVEAAQRLVGLMPDSIDAMLAVCLNELCRDGNYRMATTYLMNLNKTLAKVEPGNAELYASVAAPFIRLAARRPNVLDQCAQLLERAISLRPDVSSYKTELAYVQLLLGNIPQAKDIYQSASKLDPHNPHALHGLIRCQLFNGQFDAAEEQLEILHEVQMVMGRSAEIAYLSSLLAWYKYNDASKRMRHLKDAVELQLGVVNNGTLRLDYYVLVNPDFLLEIVRDYMDHCPTDAKRPGEDLNPIVRICHDLLQVICRIVPGCTEAVYNLAKVEFLSGDFVAAQVEAAKCLKLDATFAKTHILMSQIHLSNSHAQLATQSLETGLSSSFELRHVPLFHILKGKAQKLEGQLEEALKTFTFALGLPGMKESGKGVKKVPSIKQSDTAPSLGERLTLHVELADTYTKLKRVPEATKIMQDALRIFSGTPEQDRITIANADLCVERGEIDAALRTLGGIEPDSPYFIEANCRMANIYLKHKNDRKGYARCYSKMVERNPTIESCILLGDAYMNIQEPEQAIAVYESALESNPEGVVLASKIGKALVKTHNYSRAINYYESALSNESPMGSTLRYELAELYKKLKQWDDAERVILEALEHPKTDEMEILVQDVKSYLLLAQAYKGGMKPDKAVTALLHARDLQIHILAKDPSSVESKSHRIVASNICFELAELHANEVKDTDKALGYYNEAIQYNNMHKKAMLSLAKLHLQRNDLAAAQAQCSTMLRTDVASDQATLMLADIMYRKNSYAAAAFHFRQLLETGGGGGGGAPGGTGGIGGMVGGTTNYNALMRVVEMTRRSGKLEEAKGFFEIVEKRDGKVHLHPGWHYCKGLYARYTNNPNEALKEFNFCRRDAEWGERALYNMVEIFLNPGNETIGGEALESVGDGGSGDATGGHDVEGGGGAGKTDTELLAILTADKLLKELPQHPKSLRTQVLECQALMATKQKPEIERALSRLMEILNVEREYVPALLGMAVAYMLLKQPPRARNQLKRISKMDWTDELADDFEKSWILLADIYIQGGKFDLATDLLKRCLQHNRSCAKAWEYLGHIMEKEASYKDAAEHYESAWRLEGETNPAMGYKLAFNYMKAKRFVEAIDVCHRVLGTHPDYPKMRKEILERARSGLRMP
ncbi:Tetratricopeptide repeat protein 21B [Borealophlyctis nickersoniae]|nr:Tetratricopeptide repeat protein 21B [Borealophlyctis nickersoniae]